MRALVRSVCIAVVRFFHRQISVRGRERIPPAGPVLIVANHPNGLIDPALVRIAVEREVGFMAKATLFENPVGRIAMEAFAAVPVYRAKDGKDTSTNEQTFAAVRERFHQGRWVVIFPEGHSHSEPSLQRLKTGAARLALSFEAQSGFEGALKILPAGLLYEDKERFRSRAAVVIGEPIVVSDYADRYRRDPWEAAVELTGDIAAALAAVVLEAESAEVWRGFLAVARWTSPEAAADIAECERRARELAAAYEQVMAEDPALAHEIADDARRFVRTLEAVGVEDPFSLAPPRPPSTAKIVVSVLGFAVGAAPAALGWVLNAPAYYGTRVVSRRFARSEHDIVSSVKAVTGMLFFPLLWLFEGLVTAAFIDAWSGIAVAALAPVSGMIAVYYFERIELRRAALVGIWLRFTRRHVVESVLRRRELLVARIESALASSATRDSTGSARTAATRDAL